MALGELSSELLKVNTMSFGLGGHITSTIDSNTAGHAAYILDSTAAVSISAPARLLSVRYQAFPVFEVDGNGGDVYAYGTLFVGTTTSGADTSNGLVAAGTIFSTSGGVASTTSKLNLLGVVTDSSTSTAVKIGSYLNLTTGGSKLLSVVNNLTTETAFFDFAGQLWGGILGSWSYLLGEVAGSESGLWLSTNYASATNANYIIRSGGSTAIFQAPGDTVTLQGNAVTASGRPSITLNSNVHLTTAGDKIISFKNNGSEVGYLDYTGLLAVKGIGLALGGGGVITFADSSTQSVAATGGGAANPLLATGNLPYTIKGDDTNSGSGHVGGVILDTQVNINASGTKIHSFRNNGNEIWFFDNNGDLQPAGGGGAFSIGAVGNPCLDGWFNRVGTFNLTNRFDSTHNYVSLPFGAGHLTLKGWEASSGSALGVIIDASSLTTAGDKILSVRNGGTEQLAIDKDGVVLGASGSPVKIKGSQASSGSAINVIIDGPGSYGIGDKLLSVRNGNTEHFFIDYLGFANAQGIVLNFGGGGSITFADGSVQSVAATGGGASNPLVASGAPYTIKGDDTNTSGHVGGVILDSVNSISTSGAKLHSFRNNGTEVWYMDNNGGLQPGSPAAYPIGGSGNPVSEVWGDKIGTLNITTRFDSSHNYISLPFGASYLQLQGWAADGSSAIGLKLNNAVNLTAAGAKIISFENASTEKSYVDKDGKYGGPDASGTTSGGSISNDGLWGRVTWGANGTAATVNNAFCTSSSVILIINEGTQSTWVVTPGSSTFTVTFATTQTTGQSFSYFIMAK